MKRWGMADVSGDSMLPTLPDGSTLIVRWGAQVTVGDVVVARRPDRPALLVVKRITRAEGSGWWIEGDNPEASDDSRLFGAVTSNEVLARVLVRWQPGRPTLVRRGPRPAL